MESGYFIHEFCCENGNCSATIENNQKLKVNQKCWNIAVSRIINRLCLQMNFNMDYWGKNGMSIDGNEFANSLPKVYWFRLTCENAEMGCLMSHKNCFSNWSAFCDLKFKLYMLGKTKKKMNNWIEKGHFLLACFSCRKSNF